MAGNTHSNIDLDMLTDEEREGLLDDTVVDEGLEDGAEGDDDADNGDDGGEGADNGGDTGADAGDGVSDAGDGGQAEGADAAAAAAAAAATAADTGAVAGDDGGTGDDAGVVEEVERPASWILPPDINDKIKNLDDERDRIAASFDDGDLTAQEMRAKLKPIEQELDALKDRRTAANVSRDLAIETYKTQTVPAFFKEHTQYEKGTVLYDMLDTELRKLQAASLDPLNPKHLQKAHEIIDGQLRKALGDGAVAKKDPGTKTPAGKTPAPKREIPPTLANVPSADITDAEDGGEFSYLDRLANTNVEAYEQALGKLSDDKRERYLAQ
ncbi:hypothetical protein IB276_10795 [Ensifer sp. ENS04]|uniref:hypothetical protein n=1 Tax=Ensifer sp. ENS04 TaxID=2769281 RepID=UPI001780952E|nr:hypothetical protein [Ensifer sp. ENS04]MBD9539938.1 hypothetical protein [Ensifer sp. ENS04]